MLWLLATAAVSGCAAELVVDDGESDESSDPSEEEFGSDQGLLEPGATAENDTCATAEIVTAITGGSVNVEGTLLLAEDDYETFCADDDTGAAPGQREVVYELHLASECSAVFTVTGGEGFTGALSLRTSACETDEYCMGINEVDTFHVALDAGTYWAVVSGADASSNEFMLTLECNVPACGDGLLNAEESCDDGNTVAGDGCEASCEPEAADASVDTCGGATGAEPIAIGASEVLRIPGSSMGSTIGATDSGTGTCMLQPDGFIVAAPDHVRRVRPTVDGTLKVTIGLGFDDVPLCGADPEVEPSFPFATGCYDRSLHVRTGCEEVATQVGCSDSWTAWWATEEVVMPVTAGTDYFVFVDGYHDDEYGAGSYVLRLEMQP